MANYLQEKGFACLREFPINGKIVDLCYDNGPKRIFVEIEDSSDWKSNITRAAPLCDRLISLSVRESELNEALRLVLDNKISNVIPMDAFLFREVLP